MKSIKKIPYSLKWDWRWFTQNNVPLAERVAYVFRKYLALIARLRHIKYLGIDVVYDNVNTPMMLESYPSEINLLHREINFNRACVILDIGANIGHFSITLGSLFPGCKLFAFEANPEIFGYLSRNTASLPNVQILNTAIGPRGKLPFYYLSGRSASGSFLRENIGTVTHDENVRTLEVDVTELTPAYCRSQGIPQVYDLIKIDVEGFEYQVLRALQGIQTRYLYVEFSNASARRCNYEMNDLFRRIEDMFGRFSIIYCDRISPELSMGNMLIKCLGDSTGNCDA
jgi:FkbM family methyltransferase